MPEVSALEIITELFDRLGRGEVEAVDELLAEDMINHAGGPQGREGWKQIGMVIANDLGAYTLEHHHMVGNGNLAAHHMTIHGTHLASTMPLLAGVPVTGRPVAWTYMHLWRVADGQIVEHWACRDDVGLLAQIGAWPR